MTKRILSVVLFAVLGTVPLRGQTSLPGLSIGEGVAPETVENTLLAPESPAVDFPTPARKPDIHYVPTPQEVVDEMLKLTKVTAKDTVYDLGSGDGRIVITAAKEHGASGIGIDIDPARIQEAEQNARTAGVVDLVEFRLQDIFKSDFTDATVVTLYLLETINTKLRPKLLAETKPGTRVASHQFMMGDWKPDAEVKVETGGGKNPVYYWVVPANVSGTWKLEKAPSELGTDTIEVEQKFQVFTVSTVTNGQKQLIGEGRLTGEDFVFTRAGAPSGAAISGKVSGDQITVASAEESGQGWTARRVAGTEQAFK